MEKPDWIVVANPARARVLEQGAGPVRYAHVADLVPVESRLKGVQADGFRDGSEGGDRAGHAQDVGPGQRRAADAPPECEQDHFAREVAHVINDGVARGRCAGVTLVACDPFLGQVTAHLDGQTRKAVRRALPGDFILPGNDELARRLQQG